MNADESHFLALKALVESAKVDPSGLEWCILRAYQLGCGELTIGEVLAPPPKKEPEFKLRIVDW